MRVSVLRKPLKRALHGTPFYRVAKRSWDLLRVMEDRAAFKAQYPSAEYVSYSKDRLSQLRSDGYYSQFGQDYYLWNTVFRGLERPGFFVEVGANHPRANSNSLLLEQKGWSGVAFDPIASFAPMWAEQRRTPFHNVAVSAKRETRKFVEILADVGWEHQLSGFEGYLRPDDVAIHKSRTYDVECGPLADYIDDGQVVDIAFVDVEGAEELVLAGIDFERVSPRYFLVENMSPPGGGRQVRDLLAKHGYRLVARVGATDDLFELDVQG
ncbi:FkbM family methyltransferase [Phenylobacterium sp.]|uniref:FkbM family methyltransferase n=1 Tax=Phenylobacterium sp. TaxID=1871053 RepID=UPI00301B80C1